MQFGAPNFRGLFDAYQQGAEWKEQSRLRDLAEQGRQLQGKALSGDQNALAQLGQIDPQAYMQTARFTDDQKKERLGQFLSAAYNAKDPQSWAQVVQRFKAQGHQFGPGEEDFGNRENLIRQGMSVADQMGYDWRAQESRRAQANSDRAYGLDVQQFAETRRAHQAQEDIERGKAIVGTVPSGYQRNPDGSLSAIQGGPADPKVKASQGAGGITTKMHNDAVSVNQAYNNLDAGLKDYDALIKKTGVSVVPGSESDQIQQARTNLQLQLKELYNLGVLNGPDLGLMQQMIFDPQVHALDPIGSGAKLLGAAGYGETVAARASKSIKNLRDTLKSIRDNKTKGILDENGNFVGGNAPSAPQGGPEPGVIEDNYRFLGGDPADQNNWEPVQ